MNLCEATGHRWQSTTSTSVRMCDQCHEVQIFLEKEWKTIPKRRYGGRGRGWASQPAPELFGEEQNEAENHSIEQ